MSINKDSYCSEKTKSTFVLILVDGIFIPVFQDMLRDGELPGFQSLIKKSAYTFDAKTVYPPIIHPAVASLFYSKLPQHFNESFYDDLLEDYFGLVYKPNTYYKGKEAYSDFHSLFNILDHANKTSAITGAWPKFVDVVNTGNATNMLFAPYSDAYNPSFFSIAINNIKNFFYISHDMPKNIESPAIDESIEKVMRLKADFVFIYFENLDLQGHRYGTGNEYKNALKEIDTSIEKFQYFLCNNDYTIIISDHGRDDKYSHSHHSEFIHNAMSIPIIFYGKNVTYHKIHQTITISDISPTIANILGVDKELYVDHFDGKDFSKGIFSTEVYEELNDKDQLSSVIGNPHEDL